MSKTKTQFVCQECGAQTPRWVGKCPNCSSWNSCVEERAVSTKAKDRRSAASEPPVLLADVEVQADKRYQSGITELDRVLGGGVLPGAVTLIGGDPGIGKSTLSLQLGCALSQKGLNVLYVSGEESIQQTRMRAERLGAQDNASLFIVNQVDMNLIQDHIRTMKPDIVFLDSIQVVYSPDFGTTPGSVSQVRECSALLTQYAKSTGMALFIIGHVTKDGSLAGPKVLEHIVDTVLYFEGERYSSFRVLRAIKNRFGSTNEIGVFEMTSAGLTEITNPSEIFLSERPHDASGSVVVPIMEGTRPFLVEIQGLVSRASYGMVRQKAQGFDSNRLALLVAVMEKRLGLNLQDNDIFLNVVGGVRVMDPAADLGVVLSVASAFLDKAIPFHTVVLGEVGLSAEVRSVSQIAARLNEAEKLGFKYCLVPENNMKALKKLPDPDIQIIPVAKVKDALDAIEHLSDQSVPSEQTAV